MKIEGIAFQLKGKVQGVGMRFTIARLAQNLDLKGYVKNTKDGRVMGEIVGPKDRLETFFQTLTENAPGKIVNIDKQPLNEIPDYTKFKIKLF